MLDDAARTAAQAADALGVVVGQIAKSIIFRRKEDDAAVLVITSGDRRVDEKKVAALVGKIGRADAEFAQGQDRLHHRRRVVAGAHRPACHLDRPRALRFSEIWAAAGHPHGVFKLAFADLERLTGAAGCRCR